MPDSTNTGETTPKLAPQVLFEDSPPIPLCSTLTCRAGHVWVPFLQTVTCPGCQAPMLALKMVNCPQCNEPSTELKLRMDHLPKGGSITPLCKGSASLAENIGLAVKLGHAAETEAKHIEKEMPSKV